LAAIGYATTSFVSSNNIRPFFNHPFSKQDTVDQIACTNVGDDRNRPWTNVVWKIGEVQENNDAICLAALESDQREPLFRRFSLFFLQIRSRPCPCSAFQAVRDRRYFFYRQIGTNFIFLPRFPRRRLGQFFGYACAYSG